MNFPSLQIGHMTPEIPVMQGGMGVGISLSKLSAAVANAGGIGIISGTGISVERNAISYSTSKKNNKRNGLYWCKCIICHE